MSLFNNEKIQNRLLEDEMQNSYLDYSMSVIVARALPDVRDGLKPVHRRILYAMSELGINYNKAHKKSARVVGEVLGKYHPHGDSSVYDAMVRLAQPWNVRYRLIDGQGNFGSVDNDPPAAMRYTEARLSEISSFLLQDLDKETVDFRSNFDDSLKEPTVLPSVFPTLLVNGASGIAVGMATNLPPHNLREVIAGLKAYIDNPDITIEELMQHVPAPDFPTGGIIYGYNAVRDAYLTGRGKIIVRGKAAIEESKNGKSSIVITELPYQVNKSTLIEKIADLVKNKLIEGISDLTDESDRDGLRVVIDLRRDSVPNVVLNNLFKQTQMQVTFGVINLALVKGRPIELNLKQMMQYFIEFRNEVIVKRTQYDLNQAEKRAHILEGFIIALDNIDEVVKTIRASADAVTASASLQEKFELSEVQAKAILEMRLQRLTGLERDKILNEYKEIIKKIEWLRSLLASKALQMLEIHKELDLLNSKFGDERRTQIVHETSDFSVEDMIADEDVIVTITSQGYIKRTKLSVYRSQKKGGRGLSGAGTRDEDYVEQVFQASTHEYLLFFTDRGIVYRVKVYDLPEGARNAKGKSLSSIINKQNDEKVTACLSIKTFDSNRYVVMCTRKGTIKKTELSSFANVRSSGIIAIHLNDDDKMIGADITNGNNEIIIASREGLACRFNEEEVRSMGRNAAGVRGISLSPSNYVVSMVIIKNKNEQLLVIGEKGLGKRTPYEEFRLTRRGAKGVIAMNVTMKTGPLIRMLTVTDNLDLVVMTKNGILIRQPIANIRVIGRNTQGVKLIRLDDNDSIADITAVVHEDEDETETNEENNNTNPQETIL